jgi:hypothetical protein
MQANQMNGLYPIIRRVRRPLLPVEAPAGAKPVVVPAAAPGGDQSAQTDTAQRQPEEKHGEAASSEPTE